MRKEFAVQYTLPEETIVTLSVFDVTGALVTQLAAINQPAGFHLIACRHAAMPRGVYFIKLDTGDASVVRKAIFLE